MLARYRSEPYICLLTEPVDWTPKPGEYKLWLHLPLISDALRADALCNSITTVTNCIASELCGWFLEDFAIWGTAKFRSFCEFLQRCNRHAWYSTIYCMILNLLLIHRHIEILLSVRFGTTTEVQSEKASLNFARFFVCECILKRTTRTPQTMEMWRIIAVTLVLLQPVISRENSPCRNKPLYKCNNLFGCENFPLVLRLHITVHAFPIYATCARVGCNLGRLECKWFIAGICLQCWTTYYCKNPQRCTYG